MVEEPGGSAIVICICEHRRSKRLTRKCNGLQQIGNKTISADSTQIFRNNSSDTGKRERVFFVVSTSEFTGKMQRKEFIIRFYGPYKMIVGSG